MHLRSSWLDAKSALVRDSAGSTVLSKLGGVSSAPKTGRHKLRFTLAVWSALPVVDRCVAGLHMAATSYLWLNLSIFSWIGPIEFRYTSLMAAGNLSATSRSDYINNTNSFLAVTNITHQPSCQSKPILSLPRSTILSSSTRVDNDGCGVEKGACGLVFDPASAEESHQS